jgi:hypothetical protein
MINKNENLPQVEAVLENGNAPDFSFSKRIGSTTYNVNAYFSETRKETVQDKIMRLIEHDIANEFWNKAHHRSSR